MSDDWKIWILLAVLFFVVSVIYWALASWVRALARSEIKNALKGYVAGQVLRPRNRKGQFR